MPSYTLELELLGVYMTDMPGFEIWEDGVMDSSYTVSSSGTSISVTISYGGTLPSSLEFRFNDASPESGRTIEIQSVKINDRYVNTGNFLSSNVLTNGGNATVDIAPAEFIFDISAEPDSSEFTTGATRTFDGLANRYYGHTETADEVFDMLAGNDTAYTGSGNDKVSGGDGNDLIRSNDGNDLLFGDAGNDRIYAGAGDDYVHGGDDNDYLFGNDGDDELHGGAGVDRIYGHADNDILTGGLGNDTLGGGDGDDSLFGDEGDDYLIGGLGNDTLDGGADNDVVYGGVGDDIIDGGDGNDILVGNAGLDTIDGGDGDDTIFGANDADVLRGRAGDDTIYGGTGDDNISGGDGNDYILGGADADILSGNGDQDSLSGGAGDDILDGGVGADTLYGGAGIDILSGGDGNDIIHGDGFDPASITGNVLWLDAADGHTIKDSGGDSVDSGAFSGSVATWMDKSGHGNDASGSTATLGTINGLNTVNFTNDIMTTVDLFDGTMSEMHVFVMQQENVRSSNFFINFNGSNTSSGGRISMHTPWGNGNWYWDPDIGERTQINSATAVGDVTLANAYSTVSGSESGLILNDGAFSDIDPGGVSSTSTGGLRIGHNTTDHELAEIIVFDRKLSDAEADEIEKYLMDKWKGGTSSTIGSDDVLDGGGGDDLIYGYGGDDLIDGGADNDDLYGGAGNDTLNGGDGIDRLYGGVGDDTLNGGDGLDTLYGSSGNDVFMFEATTAYNDLDVIENFGYSYDNIDLSDLLTSYTAGTDDITDFVQFTEAGGNTTIAVDANGTIGGVSFSNVAIVNGVIGLDVAVMEIDGTLIV